MGNGRGEMRNEKQIKLRSRGDTANLRCRIPDV
jgi:hypothetical protein